VSWQGRDLWSFNLYEACVRAWAEKNKMWYERCRVCGEIYECGSGCSSGHGHDGPVGLDNLVSFARDSITADQITQFVPEVMENKAFPIFRRSVRHLTRTVEGDIKRALEALQSAKSGAEYLAALTWASHVRHVSGLVMNDYSGPATDGEFDLSGKEFLDRVQEEGLAGVFGEEAVQEFMESY
jgi:hypothetical protein